MVPGSSPGTPTIRRAGPRPGVPAGPADLGGGPKQADDPLATIVIEGALRRERGQPRSQLILEDHGAPGRPPDSDIGGNNGCMDLDDVFGVLAGEPGPDAIGVASSSLERVINGLDVTTLRPDVPAVGPAGNDHVGGWQLLDHGRTERSNHDLRNHPGPARKMDVDRHGVVGWHGRLCTQRWSRPSPPIGEVFDGRPNPGNAHHAECSWSRQAKGPDQHTAEEFGRGSWTGWRQARQDMTGEDRVGHQRTGAEENDPDCQRSRNRPATAVR